VDELYGTPCPIPGCPAYEPNSGSFFASLSTRDCSRRERPTLLCNQVDSAGWLVNSEQTAITSHKST
jgi:hypothetical protein